jgi:hypothetical protein
MSNVFVPYGDSAQDTATLLLAEADKGDLDPAVVRSVQGGFMVEQDLADKAGVQYEGGEDKPAKKTAAKKSSK